jgi:hypothetical protein
MGKKLLRGYSKPFWPSHSCTLWGILLKHFAMTLAVRLMILKRIKSMPKMLFSFYWVTAVGLSSNTPFTWNGSSLFLSKSRGYLVTSHSLYTNQSCTLANEHCSSYTNQRWDYLCCWLWKQLVVWNDVSGLVIICYGWKGDPVEKL